MDDALLGQTPWQTIGPFFHYALPWRGGADLVAGASIGAREDLVPEPHFLLSGPGERPACAGEVIEIVGRVLDGAGEPLADALIEIWQADPAGQHRVEVDEGFIGFGRAATGDDGRFRFRTLKPGPVDDPDYPLQAPHIAVGVTGRGLLKRLVTRLYFDSEAANATDPVLALVPETRRGTLLAAPTGDAPGSWRFDIVLQGDGETVFFAF
jgi:protocatechuate 3,4-dioxygenase alpha subunit